LIAYVDASILLRVILRQTNALKQWTSIERGIASGLVKVECLRTLDCLRLRQGVSDGEIAIRRETVFRMTEAMDVVDVNRAVLERASQPLPTSLGTLDAIHLATALLWQENAGVECVMATHDAALGLAATASGLRVIGL
jgi:uncharacterized protein